MLGSAASKAMWVGRATVFLVGLAVILALLASARSWTKSGPSWLAARAALGLGRSSTRSG
jgi:hypothetical protein